jgi:anti-sigma-K factor RskA
MAQHRQDDLPSLLLWELPPSEAAEVDRHLAGCDACRRDLAAVAVASSALRDASRLSSAEPVDLAPLRLQAAPEPTKRRRRAAWYLVAAAVLVAAVLVVAVALRPGGEAARQLALRPTAGGSAVAEVRMRGKGDRQVMTMDARGLPHPTAGSYYQVWLVGGQEGDIFPVGVLPPDGHGIWSLPTVVATRYRVIEVTLEPGDGNPARSSRAVLRGAYA